MIDLIETLPQYSKQLGKLKSLELEPVDVIKQARTSKWERSNTRGNHQFNFSQCANFA